MSDLTHILVPVFGLMALGFATARLRLMDEAGIRGLVLFVFTFSIPALLLTSMAGIEFPQDIEWGFLVAFYTASLTVYAVGAMAGAFFFGRALADQAIFAMGAAFSNLVMIGIPVVLTALGPEASLPMMLIIGFHSATFMPLTVILVQAGRRTAGDTSLGAKGVLLDVVRNPIIIGIFLGLLINLGGVTIWSPAGTILDLLGRAAVPCALFAMGASLAGYPLTGDVPPAIVLTLLKLVLHPLLVWMIAVPVMGLDGPWVSVAVLMASMPSAVNVYLFGARYEAAPGVAARTVLLTTLGSIVSISVVLTLIGV